MYFLGSLTISQGFSLKNTHTNNYLRTKNFQVPKVILYTGCYFFLDFLLLYWFFFNVFFSIWGDVFLCHIWVFFILLKERRIMFFFKICFTIFPDFFKIWNIFFPFHFFLRFYKFKLLFSIIKDEYKTGDDFWYMCFFNCGMNF